jgi:hypothetical protein
VHLEDVLDEEAATLALSERARIEGAYAASTAGRG